MRPSRVPCLLSLAILAGTLAACGNDRDEVGTSDGGLGESSGEIRVCTRCGACTHSVAITSANHVSGPVTYPDPPPAGGDHNPCWALWGVHADPVPAERFVHNLEHGGVVVLYDCADGCPTDAPLLAQITDFVGKHPQALMTPYTGMRQKFAIVSWGRRLVSDCIDPEAVAAFYAVHVNRAPESIPDNPDPSCD